VWGKERYIEGLGGKTWGGGEDNFGDLVVGGKIIWKLFLRSGMGAGTGLIWLRIGRGGWLL